MAVIEHRIEIEAPRALVYRVSQDYAVRYEWDPFPERIEFLGDANDIKRGDRVLVIAKSGLRMEVEFVQLAPPERAAVVMINGPSVLASFAGSWVFHEVNAAKTQAVFRYVVKTKWWAFPWVADAVSSWYFGRAVKARLAGLKAYCEQTA